MLALMCTTARRRELTATKIRVRLTIGDHRDGQRDQIDPPVNRAFVQPRTVGMMHEIRGGNEVNILDNHSMERRSKQQRVN